MRKFLFIVFILFHVLEGKAQLNELVRSTPEAEGIASRYVKQFLDTLQTFKTMQIHSCIIVRHGRVIGEMYPTPWKKDYCHTLYSASKTFTAAAVGMCISDSLFTLNDSIYKYLGEHFPEETNDTLQGITIRDLLTMQSGLPVDTRMRTVEREWLRFYLAQKPKDMPGVLWAYDSIVTYMLSAIIQKVTGMTLMDFLRIRLFNPLHITQVAWEESPEGITCGGWGLYLQPESMAKFGLLLLRGGEWNGVRLIDREWVEEMMKAQSTTGKYGYQMWQGSYPGWTEANGAYGQYIDIIPEKNMVVVITACNYQGIPHQKLIKTILASHCQKKPVAVVHRKLYKKVNGRVVKTYQLASDQEILREAQRKYAIPTIKGSATSHKCIRNTTIQLAANVLGWQSVILKPSMNGLSLEVTDADNKTYTLELGNRKWTENTITGLPYNPRPFLNNFSNLPQTWKVAGCYGWSSDGVLNVRLCYTNWFSGADLSIKISGAAATFTVKPTDSAKRIVTTGWILE